MCDTRCQHTGFAGSGAGEHQHRAVQRLHRLALLGIEIVEIFRAAGAAAAMRARGDPARLRIRRQGVVVAREFVSSDRPFGACQLATAAVLPANLIPKMAFDARDGRGQPFAGMAILRPAASGTGSFACAGLHAREAAATSGGNAAVLPAVMSTCSDMFSDVAET